MLIAEANKETETNLFGMFSPKIILSLIFVYVKIPNFIYTRCFYNLLISY